MRKFLSGFMLVGFLAGCSGTVNNEKQPVTEVKNSSKLQTVRTPDNNCEDKGIKIVSPTIDEETSFPIYVEAVVDNTGQDACRWTVFEAQAGVVKAYDEAGSLIASGVFKTVEDWMTDGPVTYKAILNLEKGPVSKELKIIVTEENPSGLGKDQKIEFKAILK